MPPQPFRFNHLPSELRNRVYKLLLGGVEEPEDYATLLVAPKAIAKAEHNAQTSILAVNRQIHAEAKDVLHREIKFVKFGARLAMPNTHVLKCLIKNKCVPVFTTNKKVIEEFKGEVMTYTIVEKHTDLPKSNFICLIAHRDLDLFCSGLANAEAATPGFWTNVTHTITLFAPYHVPPSVAKSHQEKLLAPFRKHLHGLDAAVVQGEVDEALAAAVAEQLKTYVVEEPDVILEKLRRLKDEGNDYFSKGDSRGCSESWARACMEIRRLRGGGLWATLASDTSFAGELTALYFTFNLNLSQNTLKNMVLHPNHPDFVADQANVALTALRNAYEGLSGCEEYWQPSDYQMAKLWYRKAKSHRLCGDFDDASQAIKFAEDLMPHDGWIQYEKRIIASKKTS
ncbi:unnamed protein product [Clonostachys rosea]|uniref:Uncharacterized protein n=1 Tax=Bionectria ochroleuca TaxID=29856 RepID=A0ABY6UQW5_BIOOC|nr:unnamed protein product [Clonostachys rosea]